MSTLAGLLAGLPVSRLVKTRRALWTPTNIMQALCQPSRSFEISAHEAVQTEATNYTASAPLWRTQNRSPRENPW